MIHIIFCIFIFLITRYKLNALMRNNHLFAVTFMLFTLNAEAQKVVISNGFQNIFYIGIENPVEIAVSNYACDSLSVEIDNGSIKGSNCEYTINVTKEGNTTLSVYVIRNSEKQLLQKTEFT